MHADVALREELRDAAGREQQSHGKREPANYAVLRRRQHLL